MVDLVAEKGIHGTSMSEVAHRAGVATGTAYVHYESKEDLLIASFVEVKRQLGETALAGVDMSAGPRQVFEAVWRNMHNSLSKDPAVARFLLQVEVSPLMPAAHGALPEGDSLTGTANALADHLVELPLDVLYDLGLAPVVRLVASGVSLDEAQKATLIESCWRAVHR
jgi:TetR/AcrR family transcriptional repressor of multidrug resistance operon